MKLFSTKTGSSGTLVTISMMLVATAGVQQVVKAEATLSVSVYEQDETDPLPCRAWVEAGGRHYFRPVEKSAVVYEADASFSCGGAFTIKVPAGKITVHVERGKEYIPVNQKLDLEAGQRAELRVELKRWVQMAQRGWYSSDMHLHFGADQLDVLKQLALADDVNLVPAFTYWNDFHKDWPDWPEGRNVRVDRNHIITRANEEIERIGGSAFESVGALFVFGLDRPIFVEQHDHQYPCDAILASIAKETTPECVIDTDKPLWAENVVTAAFGLFDSAQLCHNHYHRNNDIPVCCGMAGDSIEPAPRAWGQEELFMRTNMIYYRWLNCGLKMAVSGGAAMGVMPVPLGYSRTYAHIEGELTEAAFLKAVRDGRTFATSGPMLILTADGKEMGATISRRSSQNKTIAIEAQLQSIDAIDSLELIHNGRVIRQISLSGDKPDPVLERVLKLNLHPKRSGWIAARALYKAPTGRLRQAHTSPIYIEVDGKPTCSRPDAEYMVRWVDQVLNISQQPGRYKTEAHRQQCQEKFRQARQIWMDIARQASEHWGD